MICRLSKQIFEVSEAEQHCLQNVFSAHPILCKQNIPSPDLAPQEFFRQITAWGNLLNIFKSKSNYSSQPQLSRFNPELGNRICTPEEFWGLEIDNLEFGRSFDFSKPFFEQFEALFKSSYLLPLNATNCEGSDYINGAYGTKNSYLCFGIFNSQDCMYSYMLRNCSDCVDCIEALRSQFCYDCHSITDCYECRHSRICKGCQGCIFCEDCIGCQDCIFSFGLRNSRYCIGNQQVSKQEYLDYLSTLELHKRSKTELFKNEFQKKIKQAAHITNTLVNTNDCSGHFISNAQNVFNSYYVHDARDCGHIMLSNDCKDYWRGFSEGAELGYQSGSYFKAYCTYNSYMIVGGSFNLYSMFLYNSCENCFGCVGLNKKSYCILNKQYTKEEYFELIPRIIDHMKVQNEWGRFFPPNIAPNYYEDSFSAEWLSPITSEEAKLRGYRIKPTNHSPTNLNSIDSRLIPDSIMDKHSNLLDHTYHCSLSNKNFKFQKKELDFYSRFSIPAPQVHWQERIKDRISDVYLIPSI